ncbi:MAG TPA: trigger factor [Candidatus Limnocylindrales bacterium]|jgi:trigger factor
MQTTNSPLPKSRLQLEFELPPENLSRAIDKAVSRLSRSNRVPGFRPGKAPRQVLERVLGPHIILDEALEQLVDDAYREAVLAQDILPLTQPEVEITQGEEGKPVIFKATVQIRPEVQLGDFEHFGFKPEVQAVDETMVEKVVDDLRDSQGSLKPVDDRGAQKGDYAIIAFEGTRDGVPFEGGSSDRMPLIVGDDRLIPGFQEHIVGLEKGGECEFDVVFPEDYQEESLRGQKAHFKVTLEELRGKILPEANDEFARSVGKFEGMADMTVALRERLEANALDRARHDFADKIIDYAVANATIDLPDVLVDQEVDVMHDEMRSAIARQGISEEAYLKVVGKTDAEIHEELRPGAEKRVKSLLVLSEIAKVRGVEVTDLEVEVEVARARSRYANDRSMVQYFESERGRNYIRSTVRRSRTIEQLVDEWLDAHPEAPRLRHLEDAVEGSPVANPSPGAAEVIAATEPASLTPPEAAAPAGA